VLLALATSCIDGQVTGGARELDGAAGTGGAGGTGGSGGTGGTGTGGSGPTGGTGGAGGQAGADADPEPDSSGADAEEDLPGATDGGPGEVDAPTGGDPDGASDTAGAEPDAASTLPDQAPDMPMDAAPDTAPPDTAPPDTAPPDTTPPDAPPPTPTVVFSELMYHPVLEESYEDQHEFIELYNRAYFDLDLSGWKLAGEVTYTFPAGSSIPAHGYLVVAKNRTALAAVAAYGLTVQELHGDYAGQLDNSGGLVALLDAAGATVDVVRYDDAFPWPAAADALGAGETWMPPAVLPLSAHRHQGVSLQRVSDALPTMEVANWVPSPLDGATPGHPNPVGGTPPPIVQTLSAAAVSGTPLIRRTDQVLVRAGLSPYGTPGDVRIESFVDDLERTDETTTVLPMAVNAGQHEARLPAQADNSIVRYRILADLGSGLQVISPRPSDPFRWHAYFVSPSIGSAQPPYQLFIKASDWGLIWTNVNFSSSDNRRVIPEPVGGSTVRCQIRQSWDERVPAVFVSEGRVYDVRVRYQGSRWNRPSGSEINLASTSISPLPSPMMERSTTDTTQVLRALSWNISFPRFARFEGKRDPLILNKLNQSCPGLDAAVGEHLYGAAGLPSSRVRYRRVYVNGGYYAYALDIEVPDEDLLKRTTPPGERVGDLFKASGNSGAQEGPWGPADGQPLGASCTGRTPTWQPIDRYAYTYERKTWDWKDASEIQTLITQLDAARVAGNLNDTDASNDVIAPVRTFMEQNFDIESMLSYVAIRNWSEPWDDVFHNYFLYKNAAGKWSLVAWDLDREFGENFAWNARKSFFIGERGDPDNRSGNWTRIKDAFIRSYRTELLARLQYLASYDPTSTDPKRGILAPERFKPVIAAAAAGFDQNDWNASPVTNLCNFDAEKNNMLAFGDERHSTLLDQLACASQSCGLKGEYFDNRSFNSGNLKLTRTDRVVAFDFGSAAPASDIPTDSFQIRWTGQVTPAFTQSYTFYTQSDDGVRLWVNGTPLVDDWNNQGSTENSGTITLTAGVPVDIRLEYYDNSGSALVRLSWSSASQPKQILPGRALTPAP
jgi:hypothetical protein